MLTLQYQLYEDDSSGNQYLLLGNENEQGFEEAAEGIWSSAMGELQEDDEEPQVFKDSAGNHFALVGNSKESEQKEAAGALMAGRQLVRGGAKAGSSGRGGVGSRLRGMLGRNKKAVAAGAGGAGAGYVAGRSGRKESEEELTKGEVIEEDGQFFQYLGTENPLQEMGHGPGMKRGRRMEAKKDDDKDDDKEKDDDKMTESENAIMEELKAMRAEMADMRDAPQKAEAVAEAANDAATGSDASRKLIQEAAREWAQTPEEAKIIGTVIGNIIEAEREALAQEYGLNRVPHWDGEQPRQQQQLQESYVGGAGALASGGGNLQETDLSKFDENLDKLLEGVL